ncbi:MAG: GAF domain-containing protein [Candidatus Edwardsbacteria bacterium]|nr:GAF domain-containing protein [Candidatus Edwardsbacteria bacterium]
MPAPKKKKPVHGAVSRRMALMPTAKSELSSLKMKLKVLQRVNEIAASTFDVQPLLDRAMDLVTEIAPSEAGSLLLLSSDRTTLKFSIVKGSASAKLEGLEIPVGQGIAGWVAKTGIPLTVNDVASEPKWKKEIADNVDFPTRSILCVPLKSRAEVIGVVELINKLREEDYNDDDLEIIELLGAHLSTLIENSRLYSEAREKVERISAMAETSALISSSLDVKRVLETVMNVAKDVIDAEASSIFLYDEEKHEFFFEIATGDAGDAVKQIRVPWGKGMVGWAAEHMQTLLVPDVTRDPRFYSKVDEKSKFHTRNAITVPLKPKNKLIGVAQVLNKKGGLFSREDVELFETLARQAAVAIENASLYTDLQELFLNSIRTVVSLIDAKDDYTAGHSSRVTKYALMIADQLGFGSEDRKRLELAALLHDVGKIGMPDAILKKPSGLTAEEFAIVKDHPNKGAEALEPIKQMKAIIPGVRYHHEKLDGKGYPAGLSGDQVPMDAQIICVGDSYDAMNSDRPYRKGLGMEESVRRLRQDSGTQFNPKLVEAFVSALEKEENK